MVVIHVQGLVFNSPDLVRHCLAYFFVTMARNRLGLLLFELCEFRRAAVPTRNSSSSLACSASVSRRLVSKPNEVACRSGNDEGTCWRINKPARSHPCGDGHRR